MICYPMIKFNVYLCIRFIRIIRIMIYDLLMIMKKVSVGELRYYIDSI